MTDPAALDPAASLLSARVQDVLLGSSESWIRRMFEAAGELRRQGGAPVYDLSLGNPSLEPPKRWKQAVLEVLDEEPPGMHRYMTNAGFPEVRAFVAKREGARYGLDFAAEDVVMTVGAAGALNVLLRAMLDPGDEVLVPAPYFAEYGHYCANAGATLVVAESGQDFALNLAAIEAGLGPRSRIVLLNSPNNPSGVIYSESQLRELAAMLERVNQTRTRPIVVVEDNPYRDLVHDGAEVPSMLPLYAHTALLTSHSKDLGLAGERIGYLALSPNIAGRQMLAKAAGFCNRVLGFVNAPALMQRVLPLVLGDPNGRVDVGVYAKRCHTMAAALTELGFSVPDPRAGFFLFPKLPKRLRGTSDGSDGGDVEFTDRMLEERTIIVPGTAFGGPGHVRLSMATPDADVEGAIAAFRRVCG